MLSERGGDLRVAVGQAPVDTHCVARFLEVLAKELGAVLRALGTQLAHRAIPYVGERTVHTSAHERADPVLEAKTMPADALAPDAFRCDPFERFIDDAREGTNAKVCGFFLDQHQRIVVAQRSEITIVRE
ncbi:MAG: hypothetical protein P8Y95_15960 [Gammaproteobacteria bacterium]